MLKCNDDFFRSKLSANLWEESGGEDLENRHAEIYRKFLSVTLEINIKEIKIEPYTKLFFNELFDLCLQAKAYECSAALSFATEGIVSRLYSIFVDGLKHVGLNNEALKFFLIHIECDDEHALVLEEMTYASIQEEGWLTRCSMIVDKVLKLRNEFFNHLYQSLNRRKIDLLVNNINSRKEAISQKKNIFPLSSVENNIYKNKTKHNSINFSVDRVDIDSSVLDPRILTVFPNSSNELHQHAHETVFYILQGEGNVVLGSKTTQVKQGDFVYIPRWVNHQTKNTGDVNLRVLAITDFGLTKCFPENTDHSYRKTSILSS